MKDKLFSELSDKISTKKCKLGLVGSGYVGYTLGLAAAKNGFETIGFDLSKEKVDNLNELGQPNLRGTYEIGDLHECDFISICVPTPIDKDHNPDLHPVIEAAKSLIDIVRPGQLFTLESTVAPGTTREVVLPELEKSGLSAERDFFVGYSPHRIDFGNPDYTIGTIPKVVAGIDEPSQKLLSAFLGSFVQTLVPVSTLETAEMTKILENTFRLVNINLINEIAEYCTKRDINLNEVVDAAATKPFGFLAHYPSAGISGHCIPVDPYYLLEDAQKKGVELTLVKDSFKFHEKHIDHVVEKALECGKRFLIVGVAIKPGSDDTRESVAGIIWDKLTDKGCEVIYHDPYIPSFHDTNSSPLDPKGVDGIILVTYHDDIDYERLLQSKTPIVDPRGILKGESVIHI